MYEAAKADFEALQTTIRETLNACRAPTAAEISEEERGRAKLFVARVRLSKHRNRHT
jgi:hypothetical protein